MKKIIQRFVMLLSPVLCCLFLCSAMISYLSPDAITSAYPDTRFLSGSFPLSLRYDNNDTVTAAAAENETTKLDAELMLFGFFPVKDVSVTVSERKSVILGGEPFGIRLYTDGLVVSSVSSIDTSEGTVDPARDADIRQGDILLSVNGQPLRTNEQLLETVNLHNGDPIQLRVRRNGTAFTTSIKPAFDCHTQSFKLGLHVRDSIAGIGTMTCIDPETKEFAGLGHGICDSSSGCLMPLLEGDIVQADITSVTKGICGNPGTLEGHFSDDDIKGVLTMNSDHGVYGRLSYVPENPDLIPVAFRQETVRGRAQIITTVEGSVPKCYDIEIEDISYNDRNSVKNMVIHVTDHDLLQKTGGIVQGMSGSPIIQNGRLVGAVTHVYVNDPTHGYAVFAERMIQ